MTSSSFQPLYGALCESVENICAQAYTCLVVLLHLYIRENHTEELSYIYNRLVT